MDNGRSQFRCPHCGKTYPYRDSAKKHVMSRHMNVKYKCELCINYTFTQAAKLKRHMETVHGICARPALTWNHPM